MPLRYTYQPGEDKKWAIHDRKLGRVIGHIHNRLVAQQVVRELNTMEAADAA
jgi:hypothetical protein